MVQIHIERTIAAAPERVFDRLTDPANLSSAPLLLKARWAKDTRPCSRLLVVSTSAARYDECL